MFGEHRLPRTLRGLQVADAGEIDAAAHRHRRLIVVGSDADLAAVLTRLLRTEMLDVEVGFISRRRSPATRAYRIPAGLRGVSRARRGSARRVPLIRDETATAIVGAAHWRPPDGAQLLHGEAVVDDVVLFDGDVAGVRIEPTAGLPGLRARVRGDRSRRWLTGRAAQLGTTGAVVVRDGIPAPRAARRSTFYRHTEGWLLVG
ncbi:peptidase M50 [Candidatus Mycobacterium methanotrophicum]|uniref:Peptidase M50 n=1 Tax=Candidatus Mycobacterium methanotrophicum TaxID=2943498 RepID=A0ABY4QRJ8_9MYCO|nr:peptidase M50 [Candidatus Mycobacterium methanotrophicum]UQX13286.1 peptidase M50 [Candidatus Mycobacterium methanotrophicum]